MVTINLIQLIILEHLTPYKIKSGATIKRVKVKDLGHSEYICSYDDRDLYQNTPLYIGDIITSTMKLDNHILKNSKGFEYNLTTYYITNVLTIGRLPNLSEIKSKTQARKWGGKEFAKRYETNKRELQKRYNESNNEYNKVNEDTQHFKEESQEYPKWIEEEEIKNE